MKEKYQEAVRDFNIWIKANTKSAYVLKEEDVEKFINPIPYYEPNAPTLKKKLNPGFTVKSGKQESFIQFLLFVRRIQTIHEGLRWFRRKSSMPGFRPTRDKHIRYNKNKNLRI